MRQFLLVNNSQFAITHLVDGKSTISEDGSDIENKFYFELPKAEGGRVVIAGYKKHLTFVKSVYEAGGAYTANVTITSPQADGHYTLILVKKGLKFNERNRWTATVPVKVGDAANTIAAKLGKFFEANANNLNITAAVEGAKITITGNVKGEDFKLTGADDLLGVAVSETAAVAPLNDAAYIKDLAAKAASDAGFNYTYEDLDINPGYPLNPLAQGDKADTGFTVFTVRFAVPREVKTRDEVVHQIVQIALPTGDALIERVEGILNGLAANQ